MNDEWKELGPDEVIQDGDEFQSGSGWDPAFSAIGQSVRTSGLTVRRRVSPVKEEEEHDSVWAFKRVEVLESKIAELRHQIDGWIEKCGQAEQRAEKAEAKLAQYFDALMRSERELAETRPKFTQAEKERDEARAALDLVDLFKDEFLRIKACPDVSPEVTELCDRALSGIKQHISVLEQRDKAEKERDQLRAENAGLRDALAQYISSPGWSEVGLYGEEVFVVRVSKELMEIAQAALAAKGESHQEPECPSENCPMCNGEACGKHGLKGCDCDVIDRHAKGETK